MSPCGGCTGTSLRDRLRGHPLIFEVVPPHRRATEATLRNLVGRVVQATKSLPRVDAINVPEVLDENHDGAPFYRNLDPREFSLRLRDHAAVDLIPNKVVVHLATREAFRNWLQDTFSIFGLHNVVCVGGTSRHLRYRGPSVIETNRIFRAEAKALGVEDAACGNITIPDRPHEAARLLEKTKAGCDFATSQVLLDPEPVTALLSDYDRLCRREGATPATVLLSFAPVSDYADVEFLRWLGAPISESMEGRLLDDRAGVPEASIDVAADLWNQARAFVAKEGLEVPLGINVEAISAHNFDHAVTMARRLAAGGT